MSKLLFGMGPTPTAPLIPNSALPAMYIHVLNLGAVATLVGAGLLRGAAADGCQRNQVGFRLHFASDNVCGANIDHTVKTDREYYKCYTPVSTPLSLGAISCGGCRIQMWSGTDCDGTMYGTLPEDEGMCVDASYGSVSVDRCVMNSQELDGLPGMMVDIGE
ncbi:hypothetical protein F4778DRAFT_766630 [Xylariomycetidae sp. FL2044]|nr:hypothetical protein F4778DRAFT_766630 [Xylariomycetidae sp. FL2044]